MTTLTKTREDFESDEAWNSYVFYAGYGGSGLPPFDSFPKYDRIRGLQSNSVIVDDFQEIQDKIDNEVL